MSTLAWGQLALYLVVLLVLAWPVGRGSVGAPSTDHVEISIIIFLIATSVCKQRART